MAVKKPKKVKVQTFTYEKSKVSSSSASGGTGNSTSTYRIDAGDIRRAIKAGNKIAKKIGKAIKKSRKAYKKKKRAEKREANRLLREQKQKERLARIQSRRGTTASIDELTRADIDKMTGEQLKNMAITSIRSTLQMAKRMRDRLGIDLKMQVNETQKEYNERLSHYSQDLIDPFKWDKSKYVAKDGTIKYHSYEWNINQIDATTDEGRKDLISELSHIRQVRESPLLSKRDYEAFVTEKFSNIFKGIGQDQILKDVPKIGYFNIKDGDKVKKVYGISMDVLTNVNKIDPISKLPIEDQYEEVYVNKIYSVSEISEFLSKLNDLRTQYKYIDQTKNTLEEIYEALEIAREESIDIVAAIDKLIKKVESKKSEQANKDLPT